MTIRSWKQAAVLLALLTATATGITGIAISLHSSTRAAAQRNQRPEVQVLPAPVAASPGATHASTDALIRRYQLAVRQDPHSAADAVSLALAYMQKERETSDVTYYTLTDEALKAALKIDPNDEAAITYEAWVHMGRHDFAGAAALAHRALHLNPYDSATYGTLGDAEANLGHYQAMTQVYQRMVDLRPGLASYNRASYVRWLYGDLAGAYRLMQMAIRAGSTMPENVAWCESQLGDDYMGGGYLLAAEGMYRTALHTFPHYAPALAGLAMVDLSRGRMAAAVWHYREAIAVVPLPQYVISLGDLYLRLGHRKEAEREYALVRFIDHLFVVNHVRYGIETAMFDADHDRNLARALQLAQATERERQDIATDDTLAWVLYKNERYAEAWQAERRALRLGTKSALFDFHAGMILAKRGDVYGARVLLQDALMLNPNFHILYPAVARAELRQLAVAAHIATRNHSGKAG